MVADKIIKFDKISKWLEFNQKRGIPHFPFYIRSWVKCPLE